MLRSVDGEPLRVALGEYKARERAVFSIIALVQAKLHVALSSSTRTQFRDCKDDQM